MRERNLQWIKIFGHFSKQLIKGFFFPFKHDPKVILITEVSRPYCFRETIIQIYNQNQ